MKISVSGAVGSDDGAISESDNVENKHQREIVPVVEAL